VLERLERPGSEAAGLEGTMTRLRPYRKRVTSVLNHDKRTDRSSGFLRALTITVMSTTSQQNGKRKAFVIFGSGQSLNALYSLR